MLVVFGMVVVVGLLALGWLLKSDQQDQEALQRRFAAEMLGRDKARKYRALAGRKYKGGL